MEESSLLRRLQKKTSIGAACGGLVERGMGESAQLTSAFVAGTQGRGLGYQWCITVVETELLTFALTFLATFLEPPPRSLAFVPVASGDPC